jgi:hypothetical protein
MSSLFINYDWRRPDSQPAISNSPTLRAGHSLELPTVFMLFDSTFALRRKIIYVEKQAFHGWAGCPEELFKGQFEGRGSKGSLVMSYV